MGESSKRWRSPSQINQTTIQCRRADRRKEHDTMSKNDHRNRWEKSERANALNEKLWRHLGAVPGSINSYYAEASFIVGHRKYERQKSKRNERMEGNTWRRRTCIPAPQHITCDEWEEHCREWRFGALRRRFVGIINDWVLFVSAFGTDWLFCDG